MACDQDCNACRALGRVTGTTTLADVWRSPEAGRVRREIRDRPQDQIFCRNCPFAGRRGTDTSLRATALSPEGAFPLLLAGTGGDRRPS